jgi:oligopeptide transport system ATP-binding protein
MPLLDVQNLRVAFHTRNGVVRAVGGVSLKVEKGQTVGIVGESGSGKSVTCYSLLGLIPMPPGKIEGGTAHFGGQDLLQLSQKELRSIRGRRAGMIFQDPMTSLNPYLRVGTQIMEPLQIHEGLSAKAALPRAIQALEEVGIKNAEQRVRQYPHEFSGGMRQRVMIAMSLILRPELLIADEPTTALDVTIQKQVLDLIKERQRALGSAVILITHDLAVVREVCDYVNVMYAGRLVEAAPVEELFRRPRHAYTRALMRSIPALQKKGGTLYTIPGAPPDLAKLDGGCAFRVRNVEAGARCLTDREPPLVEAAPGHWVQDCPGCMERSAA